MNFPFWFAWFIVLSSIDFSPVNGNSVLSTSSKKFQSVTLKTLENVAPCIKQAKIYNNRTRPALEFPDDAEAHFEFIKQETAVLRKCPMHTYSGYSGPWTENLFIDRYLNSSLHKFSGLIPLFIPWTDCFVHFNMSHGLARATLVKIIRPNVIYLAVVQNAEGLGYLAESFPNILVMSAGGYGHIPIPLIKGELKVTNPSEFHQDIGFYGNSLQSTRYPMIGDAVGTAVALGMTVKVGKGENWRNEMVYTKYNLAPRGYGRTSFRFAESIQIGRIPVFMYTDVPWIPYAGTKYAVETYGFVAAATSKKNTIREVVKKLKSLSADEYLAKVKGLKKVRKYFTYQGLFEQIDSFLKDPFGPKGGELRCQKHPDNILCCDE